MKTPNKLKLTTFAVIALCVASLNLSAQVTSSTNTATTVTQPDPTTTITTTVDTAKGILALDSVAIFATNWTFVLSPRYAPALEKKIGVAIAAMHPVGTDNLYAGYRLDYLGGKFTASTVSATYQVPITLFHTFHVTPFVDAGINIAMSGSDKTGDFGAIAGGGMAFKIHTWEKIGTLGAGFSYENWTLFDNTAVYGGVVALQHSF